MFGVYGVYGVYNEVDFFVKDNAVMAVDPWFGRTARVNAVECPMTCEYNNNSALNVFSEKHKDSIDYHCRLL